MGWSDDMHLKLEAELDNVENSLIWHCFRRRKRCEIKGVLADFWCSLTRFESLKRGKSGTFLVETPGFWRREESGHPPRTMAGVASRDLSL